MPPRKPPNADEMIKHLCETTNLGTRPVPWDTVIASIKTGFATTHIKASQWFEPLVNGADRPLETLQVSTHGAVTVTHRAVGKWQRHGVTSTDWISHDLSVLGYPEDDARKLYIGPTGDYISKPRQTKGQRELWVATRSVLDRYIAQAREARSAEEEERRQARSAEDALLAERNGNVADFLRGLLRAAGIAPTWREQIAEHVPSGTHARHPTLNVARLEMHNDEAKKLATFLATLGIQPVSKDDFEPDLSNF